MSDDFITSVRVELRGAHEHVSVWVRGQLVGNLIVGIGDGDRMQAVLLGMGSGADPHWLVKDFHILYRLTERLVADLDAEKVTDLGWIRLQLQRLAPAFEECEAVRRMLTGRPGPGREHDG